MDFGLVEMAKTNQVMELIQFLLLNMFSPKIIKKTITRVASLVLENIFLTLSP